MGLTKFKNIWVKKFLIGETIKKVIDKVKIRKSRKPGNIIKNAGVETRKTGLFQKNQKRILILKLDHMGDFIVAIPAMMKLKARYPYSDIDVVVGSWNKPTAERLEIFSNIFTLDFFKKNPSVSPSLEGEELETFLDELGPYDIAVDLRWHPESRKILAKVEAGIKAGYTTGNIMVDNSLDIAVPYRDWNFVKKPMSSTLLELIDKIPCDVNDYLIFPPLSKNIKETPDAKIAIFPYAGRRVKEWGEENYKELINILNLNKNIKVVNVYVPEGMGAAWTSPQNLNKIKINEGLDIAGLYDSLSENDACVSNDSMGGHIASYLGLKTLVIFGGTDDPSLWAPSFYDSQVIFRPLPCSPCHNINKEDCKFNMACFDGITPEMVYDRVIGLIAV